VIFQDKWEREPHARPSRRSWETGGVVAQSTKRHESKDRSGKGVAPIERAAEAGKVGRRIYFHPSMARSGRAGRGNCDRARAATDIEHAGALRREQRGQRIVRTPPAPKDQWRPWAAGDPHGEGQDCGEGSHQIGRAAISNSVSENHFAQKNESVGNCDAALSDRTSHTK